MKRAIVWLRRDLRVHDNTAFLRAVAQAEVVIPVFIVEEAFRTGPDVGAARVQFLFVALRELDSALAKLGYRLVIRRGRSEVELPKLCLESGVEAVFCNQRSEPYAQQRDARVFNALNSIGVGFEQFKDAVIWEEREILTKAGAPYTVFTPYAKAWKARPPTAPSGKVPPATRNPPEVPSTPVPSLSDLGLAMPHDPVPSGEAAALAQAKEFFARKIHAYAEARDFPSRDGTSRFSAHLRAGTLSIRMLVAAVQRERARADARGQASCDTFLNELIWREFYQQILHNFPHVMRGSFRPDYDHLQWSDNQEHFDAWKEGRTGYPIVDAAMRCLRQTGWMHNRLRMITAMFLTKDLLINWQWGERHFMHALVDGDMAANNGGWQWSAGTGTDAAPYFRIFNPAAQSRKFDPTGEFIRKWVPELEHLSAEDIHEPALLRASRYPHPIVRHDEQRKKALAMYGAVVKRRAPEASG